MPTKSRGDSFNPKRLEIGKQVPKVSAFGGADTSTQLGKPIPFKRRFRPAVGTKDFSLLSDYDYASLWSRWRRGYELSMYAQQAYKGVEYSFKYYYSGTIGLGPYVPGFAFMYPTTRSDERIWTVFVQPRNSIDFRDFDLKVLTVTDYSDTVYAVKFSTPFGLPFSQLKGETVSNRYTAAGVDKLYGFSNYAVVGVGLNNVLVENPDYTALYDTLFLDHSTEKSWEVVDRTTLRVPASSPPAVGEYLATELKTQCTCPDFLNRAPVNLYEMSLKQRYPYTGVLNMKPGYYDAGSQSAEDRVIQSIDDPGWARSFGFIYLNEIYNIPSYTQENYSDPNLFYFQPKWCKHIYAAMWDLQRALGQENSTSYWLPQPSDEPTHPAYREMFDRDLAKQLNFFERERDYRWWLRYGPTREELSTDVLKPNTYNVFTKTINTGTLESPAPVVPSGLTFLDTSQYSPFVPPSGPDTYYGTEYASGVLLTLDAVNILNGGTYASGVLTSPFAYPINGGVYI